MVDHHGWQWQWLTCVLFQPIGWPWLTMAMVDNSWQWLTMVDHGWQWQWLTMVDIGWPSWLTMTMVDLRSVPTTLQTSTQAPAALLASPIKVVNLIYIDWKQISYKIFTPCQSPVLPDTLMKEKMHVKLSAITYFPSIWGTLHCILHIIKVACDAES